MRPYHVRCWVTGCALLFCAATPVDAQVTEQQRDACTPELFRLCGAGLADSDRITACLRGGVPQLSRACYEVFFPPPGIESRHLQEHFLSRDDDD